MHCQIDPSNGIPIYEQIVRHVKFSVANGLVQVGEHIPSVREMASRAAVNPNTVARAYRELQAVGLVVPIRGTGLAVAPQAPEQCRCERLDLIRQRLHAVLAEAVHHGISAEEVRTLVDAELKQLTGPQRTEHAPVIPPP